MFLTQENVAENISEEVLQDVGIFRRYFETLDWSRIVTSIAVTLVQIIGILIVFWIIKRLGNYFINLTFKRKVNSGVSHIPNRKKTLHQLSKNVFNAIAYFFLVFAVLESIGIPVGSLIAGAGVIGLAISLGAQDFVSDVVNGFMIMIEKQIDVGETIAIDDITGTVIDVNLKTTKLKGFDGAIYYVPNREISIISNRSRADMRAQIQIPLFPDSDLDKIRDILESVSDRYLEEYEHVTTPPAIIFVPLANGQLAAQITMYTEPGKEYATQMEFYERYISGLTKAGVELPANALDFTPSSA